MEKLMKIMVVVVIIGILFLLGRVLSERDPAYRPHPGTYYGRPAFVQLHRPRYDGVQYITFYQARNADPNDDPIKDSKYWIVGDQICTVPTELAISMYHEPTNPGKK